MSTTWLSAAELAGLPGLPGSERRTRDWLARQGVPSRPREGRHGGGGLEYDCAALPTAARQALMLECIQQAPAVPVAVPAPAPKPLPVALASRRPPSRGEAACADARLVLVQQLVDMAPDCGGITAAAHHLAKQLRSGGAPAQLLDMVPLANQRARAQAAISARTLFRWHGEHKAHGWHGLLPVPVVARPIAAIADDVAMVLKEYHAAGGAARNLTHCAQRVNDALMRPWDDWRQLYDRARRALPKVDKVKLIKARHTGAERAAKLPFKRRDTSTIRPLDVWVVDGHTFKAKVRHPDHGAPFAPEVTVAIDASSRLITGWSVSLSENTIAVGDCLRHAVGQHGVPAIVYSDNGAGERAKVFDCPVVGLFARLGIEHRTGIPGHPQGHGLIERSWQTHMLRCARQFGSYQGGDVDARTLRNVRLELDKEQRAVRRAEVGGEPVRLSAKAPSWRQFLDAVAECVEHYNSLHRHRSLPKHDTGPHAGTHRTPAEAWAEWLDPADQHLLDAPTLRHVFMPAVLRSAERGEVRLLNQHYGAVELMQVDGQQVRVHYDIHDASRVWVWTIGGQFVCEATFAHNRMGYMPKPAVDIARDKRADSAIKRLELKRELAERERAPALDAPTFGAAMVPTSGLQLVERIDLLPEPAEPPPAVQLVAVQAIPARPFFDGTSDRYEWLMTHRDEWTEADTAWVARYVASDDYAGLAAYFATRGLDWPAADPDAATQAL